MRCGFLGTALWRSLIHLHVFSFLLVIFLFLRTLLHVFLFVMLVLVVVTSHVLIRHDLIVTYAAAAHVSRRRLFRHDDGITTSFTCA